MRRGQDDPRVTDLRRYKRERERARRNAQRPQRPSEPLLGRRRNAGLILAAVIVAIVVMSLLSRLH